MTKELAPNQYYDEDGEICSKLPEGLKSFILECEVHGQLNPVPVLSVLVSVLEEAHREAMGCYYPIKVYEDKK